MTEKLLENIYKDIKNGYKKIYAVSQRLLKDEYIEKLKNAEICGESEIIVGNWGMNEDIKKVSDINEELFINLFGDRTTSGWQLYKFHNMMKGDLVVVHIDGINGILGIGEVVSNTIEYGKGIIFFDKNKAKNREINDKYYFGKKIKWILKYNRPTKIPELDQLKTLNDITNKIKEKGINIFLKGNYKICEHIENYILLKNGEKITFESFVVLYENGTIKWSVISKLIDILIDRCNIKAKKIKNAIKKAKIFQSQDNKISYKGISLGLTNVEKDIRKFFSIYKPCFSQYISKIVYDGEVIFGDNKSKIDLINQNDQEENNNQENLNQEQINKEADNTIENENTSLSQSNPENQEETKTFDEILEELYDKREINGETFYIPKK